MKKLKMSFLRRVLKNEQGQSFFFVALGGLAFIGAAGISMDLGNAYVARQELQASTNSAALSGAVYLSSSYFNTAKATTAVNNYSAVAGSYNTASSLTNVQMAPSSPSFVCLATVYASLGIPCLGPGAGYNAMIVTQKADVNTWFAKLFNIPVFHLTATAYATPGGAPAPLNMVIIVDTTSSMAQKINAGTGLGSSDPTCVGKTELYCAMNGVGIMLNSLPFPADAPVALFTFPNVKASTVNDDLTNSGTPTEMANSTPPASGTSYNPTGSSATYEIVPFGTSYSQIIKAVGVVNSSGTTTTNGYLQTPSGAGAGTFLAGAIVAAQSALVAQQVVHPVAPGQNVIVILSDGNVNGSDQYNNVQSLGMMASTFSVTTTPPSDIPISGTAVTYPSGVGGCGQAVQEAQIARASTLQTSIFVISFGSPITGSWNPSPSLTVNSTNLVNIINNSACPSDQDAFFTAFKSNAYGTLPTKINGASYTNLSFTPNISPCQTDKDIATPDTSEIVYFYSDTMGASSNVCPSTSGLGSLSKIFAAIVGELPHIARLVPIGTT